MRSILPANFARSEHITSKLSPQISLFRHPCSNESPSVAAYASNSVVCSGSRFPCRVALLSLMLSITWNGSWIRRASRAVPSSWYFPGQTSSVRLILNPDPSSLGNSVTPSRHVERRQYTVCRSHSSCTSTAPEWELAHPSVGLRRPHEPSVSHLR